MRAIALLFLPSLAYQLVSIAASFRHLRRREIANGHSPSVSVLKPVRGVDPDMYAALVSQVQQNYNEFEILFGVADENDAAVELIRRLQREHPRIAIHLHIGFEPGTNAKVGILMNLARHARHPVWVVNDSDIRVPSDYLRRIVTPLADESIGLVTCLYRPAAHTPATMWEAFGIAIDFMPSTLVAPLVGVAEFGLGSTLCFRAADLQAAGGFESIADYIADDYQLAKRIVKTGKAVYLSPLVVDTSLGEGDWRGVWSHQLRWARTIRASKGAGFAGLPITYAGVWAIVALACGAERLAGALLLGRIAMALVAGWLVIGLRYPAVTALLAPLWDVFAFAVWIAGYTSRNVRWRDRRLRIVGDGRLEPL